MEIIYFKCVVVVVVGSIGFIAQTNLKYIKSNACCRIGKGKNDQQMKELFVAYKQQQQHQEGLRPLMFQKSRDEQKYLILEQNREKLSCHVKREIIHTK